jgi:hypothetical protein
MVEKEKVELIFYEKLALFLRRFFPKIQLPEHTRKLWKSKIDFCGLIIEPSDVVNVTIFLSLVFSLLILILIYLRLNTLLILSVAFVGTIIIFYSFKFLDFYEKYVRIRAGTDLLLSALYMVISLQFTPNLENAVSFAASSLKGPIGRDLKGRIWKLTVGVYRNVEELINDFSKKWERENEEFVEAMELIKSSMYAPFSEKSRMYDEALNLLMERNKERLKSYTSELKHSSLIITYMGVLLPMLTIAMLPVLTIFLAQAIDPYTLIFIFDVILPVSLFILIFYTLQKRPLTFGGIDISEHPEASKIGYFSFFIKKKKINIPLIIFSLLLFSPIFYFGFKKIGELPKETVGLENITYGLIIVFSIVVAMFIFSFFSSFKNIKIKKEVRDAEIEASEAFFSFGQILKTGYSVESCMKRLVEKTKHLKINKVFKMALNSIVTLGATLEAAFFSKDFGSLKYFPSTLIKSIFKLVVETMKKGMRQASYSLLIISNYLKTFYTVETHLKDIMEETTSEIKFMLEFLLPISIGVTIGIAAISTLIVFQLYNIFSKMFALQKELPFATQTSFITIVADVNKIIPLHFFVIAMGIYLIENTLILSWFYSNLIHGEDKIEMLRIFSINLIKNFIIFATLSIIVFISMAGMIPRVAV